LIIILHIAIVGLFYIIYIGFTSEFGKLVGFTDELKCTSL